MGDNGSLQVAGAQVADRTSAPPAPPAPPPAGADGAAGGAPDAGLDAILARLQENERAALVRELERRELLGAARAKVELSRLALSGDDSGADGGEDGDSAPQERGRQERRQADRSESDGRDEDDVDEDFDFGFESKTTKAIEKRLNEVVRSLADMRARNERLEKALAEMSRQREIASDIEFTRRMDSLFAGLGPEFRSHIGDGDASRLDRRQLELRSDIADLYSALAEEYGRRGKPVDEREMLRIAAEAVLAQHGIELWRDRARAEQEAARKAASPGGFPASAPRDGTGMVTPGIELPSGTFSQDEAQKASVLDRLRTLLGANRR